MPRDAVNEGRWKRVDSKGGKTVEGTYPYSSCPAVSRTSRSATSSSMTHCFRYESEIYASVHSSNNAYLHIPSIVGSYSSTKWLWMNWIVKADFPTPGERQIINFTSKYNLPYHHHRQLRACTPSEIVPVPCWVSAANLWWVVLTFTYPGCHFDFGLPGNDCREEELEKRKMGRRDNGYRQVQQITMSFVWS